MKKPSQELYEDALNFQNERKEVTDAYEKTLADLEDKKGSRYYTDTLAKAKTTRDEALKALQTKYGEYMDSDLKKMQEANGKRGVVAPTEEELRIVNALKMRDSITESELSLIANSLKHNAMCLEIVQEVANKNGILRNYSSRYEGNEAPVQYVDDELKGLAHELRDFLQYDTTKPARIAAEYTARHYGGEPQPITKRPLFDTKEGFYGDMTGMKGDNLTAFCNAVDGDANAE